MKKQIASNRRDEQTFKFIAAYIRQFHYPPSIAEIAEMFHICESAAGKRLQRLEAFGWIKRQPRKVRAIQITREAA